MKEHGKCASDVQSKADTIQEEKTIFFDQVKMMEIYISDIIGEISNMVDKYLCAEEEIIKLNTMDSENIKSIEETRKKIEKAMAEKADLESQRNIFRSINEKYLNKFANSSGQVASFHIKPKGMSNAYHQMQQ